MDSSDNIPDPTYGQRAPRHLTSVTLTAGQHRALEPRIPDYIKLDGAERTAFVLESFKLVWEGEEIEWGMKSLWPTKQENPKWHREKKVRERYFKTAEADLCLRAMRYCGSAG